jgi:hypothetical protein
MRMASLGVGLLAAAVAACGGQPTSAGALREPGESPTTTMGAASGSPAERSAAPSREASRPSIIATARPSALAIIKIDSIATVVTDDLRVRSLPEVSDASAKLTPLLQRGQALFVVDGPFERSGYRWYQVQPIGRRLIDDDPPFGYVAAGDKTGVPWIAVGGFRCPKAPTTLKELTDLDSHAGLACFGRRPLSFPARLAEPEATCGVDIGWTIEPEWLGGTCSAPEFIVFDPKTNEDSFYSVVDPRLDTSGLRPGPEMKDWIDVKVTGSFDHPAASECQSKVYGDDESTPKPPGHDEIVVMCRAQFVISSIERR